MRVGSVNMAAIAALVHHPQVEHDVDRGADKIVSGARMDAPKDTGAGAASIHAERQPDGSVRVGWDDAHDYMRFHELGTEQMNARPFLRPAADRAE